MGRWPDPASSQTGFRRCRVSAAASRTWARIAGWIGSPALAALIGEFSDGHEAQPDDSLGEQLAWLDQFSARWDYRAGKERNLAAETEFDAFTAELVLAAASALGLRGPSLPRRAATSTS